MHSDEPDLGQESHQGPEDGEVEPAANGRGKASNAESSGLFGSLCATLGAGGAYPDLSDTDTDSSCYSDSGSSETDADRDLVRARGRPAVPLARQILVCNRRWQWELPQTGAVSLATQHILQATETESESDSEAVSGPAQRKNTAKRKPPATPSFNSKHGFFHPVKMAWEGWKPGDDDVSTASGGGGATDIPLPTVVSEPTVSVESIAASEERKGEGELSPSVGSADVEQDEHEASETSALKQAEGAAEEEGS